MATPIEIYETYRIMPNLQLHQLRVAAVAKLVCDSLDLSVDTDAIVKAALLHDMGNIIKFDLGALPGFCEPAGVPYWQGVKDDYIQKYGTDEHEATVSIAHELGVSNMVRDLISCVGFSNLARVREMGSYEMKVVEYGDLRVGPHGVISMRDRLQESRTRYRARYNTEEESLQHHENLLDFGRGIEEQIFSHSRITPADITDATAAPVIEELKHFQVV